jgi:hypothetical protein
VGRGGQGNGRQRFNHGVATAHTPNGVHCRHTNKVKEAAQCAEPGSWAAPGPWAPSS